MTASKVTLVTGAAGFIGFHLINRLLALGEQVIGLDIINDYYDPKLKYDRLADAGIPAFAVEYGQLINSQRYPAYRFIKLDLEDKAGLEQLFSSHAFGKVINLAAQAGVRYSLINPSAYIQSNIIGFANLIECCRHHEVEHLLYASSSSVYGLNKQIPFSTKDNVDHPVSLYAATKKSNELMAHTYSHLFGLPTTGLRFFTVYGPWGRPDMAAYLFTDAILAGRPIQVFNYGRMQRDFTYIDDIVEGIVHCAQRPPAGKADWDGHHPDPSASTAPYRVYNIGAGSPMPLMDFIAELEEALGQEAVKDFQPIQPGDVASTFADVTALAQDFNYQPSHSLREGIRNFVAWYRSYHGLS